MNKVIISIIALTILCTVSANLKFLDESTPLVYGSKAQAQCLVVALHTSPELAMELLTLIEAVSFGRESSLENAVKKLSGPGHAIWNKCQSATTEVADDTPMVEGMLSKIKCVMALTSMSITRILRKCLFGNSATVEQLAALSKFELAEAKATSGTTEVAEVTAPQVEGMISKIKCVMALTSMSITRILRKCLFGNSSTETEQVAEAEATFGTMELSAPQVEGMMSKIKCVMALTSMSITRILRKCLFGNSSTETEQVEDFSTTEVAEVKVTEPKVQGMISKIRCIMALTSMSITRILMKCLVPF
jgi:ribosomal protein L30/L7E